MGTDDETNCSIAFTSPQVYVPHRIGAAAMYCSDGRLGVHFDEFLHQGLGLPRYDRIALPGGPGALAGHLRARLNVQSVLDELRFLTEAHGVEHIVLIQHEDCAFYADRLLIHSDKMKPIQLVDLDKVARIVHRATGVERIEGYYLRFSDGKVQFESTPLEPSKPF